MLTSREENSREGKQKEAESNKRRKRSGGERVYVNGMLSDG